MEGAELGSGYGSGEVGSSSSCEELPAWGVPLGVIMGTFGSIGINIGQNLQASGLQDLPPDHSAKRPFSSRLWRVGLAVFVLFSLLNFAALAFAPASILTPLESIQFATNVAWNVTVNKKAVSRRMVVGVALALVDTVLSVIFGASGAGCHTLPQLTNFWASAPWIGYLATTLAVAAAALAFHAAGEARRQRGVALSRTRATLMPVAYTLSSALAGGAQMIVHSKVISELLGMAFTGLPGAVFTSPVFYLELVLVTACGIVWAWRLTACLVLYDALVILPLMVGTYILFGGVAGGLFFQEFRSLHNGLAKDASWPLYLCGMALVLIGLGCIASADVGTSVAPETGAEEGGQGAGSAPMSPTGASTVRILDGGSGEEASGADPAPGATPTAGAPRAASSGTLNKAKELAVVVKDLVDWSEQEQRLSRVLHESPGASRMPTPTAIVYSASRLIALRHRIESARQSLAASPVSEVEEASRQASKRFGLSVEGGGGSEVWVCRSASSSPVAGPTPLKVTPSSARAQGVRGQGKKKDQPQNKERWPVDRPTNQRWPTARSGGSNSTTEPPSTSSAKGANRAPRAAKPSPQ